MFSPAYSSGQGTGAYDLSSSADQVFAFHCDHSGRLDHLVLYRPGTGIVWILRNGFNPIYIENLGIDGYDLTSAHDRALAFAYESSGKLDYVHCHLQAWHGRQFHPQKFLRPLHSGVPSSSIGIADYDLTSTAGTIVAYMTTSL